MCENIASENGIGGVNIWASAEATYSVNNEVIEGTKVRNDCGVSNWVRPIDAKWLRVIQTKKMERATGIEEASDSESASGSKELSDSESGRVWKME